MCRNTWSEINFDQVSAHTLYKYRYSFQNKTKNNKTKRNTYDRYICAGKFQTFIEDTSFIKGAKTLTVGELVKAAFNSKNEQETYLINRMWEMNIKKNIPLYNIISFVDVSSMMEQEKNKYLYTAIGLGIRVSELCQGDFKNRVIAFSANPTWLQFNDDHTFVDKVNMFKEIYRGLNSNIYAAFKMFIEALSASNTPKKDVKQLTIAIFSDMQTDPLTKYNLLPIYDNVKALFKKTEIGYDLPKLLFWNGSPYERITCTYLYKKYLLIIWTK